MEFNVQICSKDRLGSVDCAIKEMIESDDKDEDIGYGYKVSRVKQPKMQHVTDYFDDVYQVGDTIYKCDKKLGVICQTGDFSAAVIADNHRVVGRAYIVTNLDAITPFEVANMLGPTRSFSKKKKYLHPGNKVLVRGTETHMIIRLSDTAFTTVNVDTGVTGCTIGRDKFCDKDTSECDLDKSDLAAMLYTVAMKDVEVILDD